MRILVLLPGPQPPPIEPMQNRFAFLSTVAGGDVLQAVWWKSELDARAKLGVLPFECGNFCYHFFYQEKAKSFLRHGAKIAFYLACGFRLLRQSRYDAVVIYGTNTPGLCGVLLSMLFRLPLVVEIPGVPAKAFVLDSPAPGFWSKIKKFVSDLILSLVLPRAQGLHLLYPSQLSGYRISKRTSVEVFHEFVPLNLIPPVEAPSKREPTILFAGFPWYLKGVDLLISAFKNLSPKYPGFRLRICGHFPDRNILDLLVDNHPRIEIIKPMPQKELLLEMMKCSLLVLPSRTEAMGRVLLEAMACGTPVAAAAVDGIPSYVEPEKTGYLFRPNDEAELFRVMDRILGDYPAALAVGSAAHRVAQERFSESIYVKSFERLLLRSTAS